MFVSGRIVVVGILALGCATSPQASRFGSSDGRTAIMDADRAFNRAAQERRGEGWAAFFADTTMWPIQLAPAGSGAAATRERSTRMWRNPNFTLEWNPIYADVAASGDLGYTIGKWTRTVKDSTGAATTAHGTYLTVWRKQKDGSWKVVADTGDEDQ
jgi:ketosteroid isomerase-like protein